MKDEPGSHVSGGAVQHALPPGFPKGLRVLVVDDDSLCLKVIEQMLRKCDYSGEQGQPQMRCANAPGGRQTAQRRLSCAIPGCSYDVHQRQQRAAAAAGAAT
jgi:CheY-like chemotaxis protein